MITISSTNPEVKFPQGNIYVCDMAEYNAKTSDYLYRRKKNFTKALSDERHGWGEVISSDGYYIAAKVWFRSPIYCTLELAPKSMKIDENEVDESWNRGRGNLALGSAIKNGEQTNERGYDKSVRIGFRIERTDLEGREMGESHFYIYEPNCDDHISDAVPGYVATPSIDGTNSLVGSAHLITQTSPNVIKDISIFEVAKINYEGTFQTSTALVELSPDTLIKMTIYVWVEAMDIDTNTLLPVSSTEFLKTLLNINLQFTGKISDTGGTIIRD